LWISRYPDDLVGLEEQHFHEFNGLDLQTGGKRTPDINKLHNRAGAIYKPDTGSLEPLQSR
jgi:hypothetical protein